jgi:hypothetical protein
MVDIKKELKRLAAPEMAVALDRHFEPTAGALLRIELAGACWRLLPEKFLLLTRELPDGAGSEAIRLAIETKAVFVWRGPAPPQSTDTSSMP